MDGDLETNFGTSMRPAAAADSKWLIWALWSGISLVIVLLAVFVAGFDTSLLLGWVVGIIIPAMLLVFRRKG